MYRFLGLLDCFNVAFAVCQKKPKCLDDAVTATLEIESILALSSSCTGIHNGNLSIVKDNLHPPPTIFAMQLHETSVITEMLLSIISRMNHMEVSVKNIIKQSAPQPRTRTDIHQEPTLTMLQGAILTLYHLQSL